MLAEENKNPGPSALDGESWFISRFFFSHFSSMTKEKVLSNQQVVQTLRHLLISVLVNTHSHQLKMTKTWHSSESCVISETKLTMIK